LQTQLREACASIPRLVKTQEQGDEFATVRILDIANAFREELFKRGLLIIPNDVEVVSESFALTDPNRWVTEVRVKTQFTVTDGKRRVIYSSYGSGRDMDGRALAIAQTGALKAWLKRIGLLFGEWDEPGHAVEQKIKPPMPELVPRQQVRQAEYQERAWRAALATCGKTSSQVEAFLSTAFAFSVTTDDITTLSPDQFDIAMQWLTNSGDDLTGTLELSKQALGRGRPQPVAAALEATGD